ncbi:DUF6597 domain-containing transcriptional factor [Algoriphagus resistens]|uniref:DUF6597 domain-containing transcriptional factor n=1 Tax=Algoriphagus resistens TaxID=1750590 RepID=UPI000716C57B|nr:AraC family transcriptional regulator [Algoriphagus resistens]
MQVLHYIPTYPLSNFIQHMVYVNGSLPIPYIKELPEGGINLIIELNEHTSNVLFEENNANLKWTVKHAWISGMQKQAIVYENNPDSTIISIRFTAGGFYTLTKIPVPAIHSIGLEAKDILGYTFNRLYESLLNTDKVLDKFKLIEDYFFRYSTEPSMEQDIVRFVNNNITQPIEWLVHRSGYSQKHLIYLLKKHTGFSTKYFKRIKRFHQVANEIQRNKGHIDWFSIVHRYGYYDQAHFIKDFSHFAGISPVEYLLSQVQLENNRLIPDMILQLPERKY